MHVPQRLITGCHPCVPCFEPPPRYPNGQFTVPLQSSDDRTRTRHDWTHRCMRSPMPATSDRTRSSLSPVVTIFTPPNASARRWPDSGQGLALTTLANREYISCDRTQALHVRSQTLCSIWSQARQARACHLHYNWSDTPPLSLVNLWLSPVSAKQHLLFTNFSTLWSNVLTTKCFTLCTCVSMFS
jgi:hypothetical protein